MLTKLAGEGGIVEISGGSALECFREMLSPLWEKGRIVNLDEAVQALIEREELRSTAFGRNTAVPHARIDVRGGDVAMSIGIHRRGLEFNAPDGEFVHVFFTLISSPSAQNCHLAVLAKIAKLVKTTPFIENVLKSGSDPLAVLKEEEKKLS